jgi:hypothetical protein
MHIRVGTDIGIRTFNPDHIMTVLYDADYGSVEIVLSDGLTYKLNGEAAIVFWHEYKKVTV